MRESGRGYPREKMPCAPSRRVLGLLAQHQTVKTLKQLRTDARDLEKVSVSYLFVKF